MIKPLYVLLIAAVAARAQTDEGMPKFKQFSDYGGLNGFNAPGERILPEIDELHAPKLYLRSTFVLPPHTRGDLDFYLDGTEPRCYTHPDFWVTRTYKPDQREDELFLDLRAYSQAGANAQKNQLSTCLKRDTQARLLQSHLAPEDHTVVVHVTYRKGVALRLRKEPMETAKMEEYACVCGKTTHKLQSKDVALAARSCAEIYEKDKRANDCTLNSPPSATFSPHDTIWVDRWRVDDLLAYRYKPD